MFCTQDKPKPEPKEGDDADEDRLGGSEGDESGGGDGDGEGESEDGGRESSPMMMEDEEDSEGEEGAELSGGQGLKRLVRRLEFWTQMPRGVESLILGS